MERALIRKGILFIIVGPAGSGKSTVCERLVREFSETLTYSTSATTRPPRPNEKDGRSYHFMSREEFEARRENGDFFEWEENHGNLYGTLRENLIRGAPLLCRAQWKAQGTGYRKPNRVSEKVCNSSQ
jgi:guanylate kinase